MSVHRHHSFVHPQVRHLQSVPQYEQRTPEWYEVRQTLMTASNAGAALGMKPFASFAGDPRDDAIQQIVYRTFTGNIATRHGQKHEDAVRDRFCEIMGVRAREYGLIRHSDVRPPGEGYDWLAASPDGITDCGMMIEIKCPYRRQIKPMYIPDIYHAQMQVQMEVCDLDRCAFVQWQPNYLSETGHDIFDIQMVERDRAWFETNRPKLQSFYDDLMEARRSYVKPPPPACLVSLTLYDDAIASEGAAKKKPRLMFCDDL
jgi:putative phage-type endonuclease